MLHKAFRKVHVIVLAGVAVAAAAGAGVASRSDLLLSRGFGRAFQNAAPALSFDAAERKGPTQGVASGDEGYWLTRAEVESSSPFAQPLAVGDRITISGHDGHERRLEVMDLKSIGEQLRLMLVTCRVADTGGKGATVRFIIEAEPRLPLPPPAKAL
jgi:hypothetical protein